MTIRTGRVATHRRERLVRDWEMAAVPAGSLDNPSQLADTGPHAWIAATRPGTVAGVLRDAGAWSLDHPPRRFDADDWWYRTHFNAPEADDGDQVVLGFDGLATLAEVWLNGEPLLSSDNMFLAHEHEVRSRLRTGRNELVMRFRSLDAALTAKRPRPAWRAPMIENQQLRWFRTTVLGRTPGWSPPAAPVGPWRDVWIETRSLVDVSRLRLHATVDESGGQVQVSGSIAAHTGQRIDAIVIEVERDGQGHRTLLSREAGTQFSGSLRVDQPTLWWPHTHGEPALYDARLSVSLAGRNDPVIVDLGRIGFRRIEVDTSQGRFAIRVNGTPVFCRGACWTPPDPVSFASDRGRYAQAIEQVRQAGMNTLRVGGTMVYEDDAFHDACDEQGVLVWQELMFSNMDYPTEPAFLASVEGEVRHQLSRLQSRPSLAVVCGNSEVEQQAAMWGATRERWTPALFHEHVPAWVRETLPHTAYWPSSAHGGAFPFQGDAGTTSYYGVGAYLRPQDDARRADLSFATECLAFANLPDASTIARMPGGESLKVTHPGWKSRTPRDLGAGWDFEDVRDHYLAALFRIDPAALRAVEHERYLELGRVATGEVMAAAFKEWRRAGSRCGGALVWFLRDLWAGAGWGLLDDQGQAKAAMHILGRALQPLSLAFTDEGGNGLCLHMVNEEAAPVAANLFIAAYNESAALVGHGSQAVMLDARTATGLPVAGLFDGFLDLSAAYRFGPPPAQVVVVSLLDNGGNLLAQDFHFPAGLSSERVDDVGLAAAITGRSAEGIELTIHTERLAQHVCIAWPGFVPADNHFHLAPRGARTLSLRGQAAGAARRGTLRALNSRRIITIEDST
jgi:beta-mannosidase